MRLYHALAIALAVLVTSWSGPLARLATQAEPLAIAFWRTLLATAILLPLALLRNPAEVKALRLSDYLKLAGAAGFLALHFATWIASIDLTTIAASVLLVTSVPVWVALASVVLGERLPKLGWAGIVVGIAGGALIAVPDVSHSTGAGFGNFLAIAGAVTAAGYLMVGGRLRQRFSIYTYTAMVYGMCSAMLLAGALVSHTELVGFSRNTWVAIAAIALGPQLVGHTAYNYLLEHLETWKISVAVLGEPVGSTIIAVFLFAEIPGILVLPGGVLLLTGIAMALIARRPVGIESVA